VRHGGLQMSMYARSILALALPCQYSEALTE
jgi:hypothetical protein